MTVQPADGPYRQPSLDELGTPLSEVTFTVVDLETTGVAADAAAITEIGAVKVRGGEVIGEFATLVNPGEPIDARISLLTGITDEMVADAPPIRAALPSFLEFATGSTWVAHNAPFDMSFLRAACAGCDLAWPRPPVLDTVVLARRLIGRDEVPNRRLSTLARHFHARVRPSHRALSDARATVDVLHALLERVAGHGVVTDTDLADFCRAIPAAEQRRKRHLAAGLPHVPGVYIFRDADDRPLYIGTSRDVATRVRSYFSGAETRSRLRDMLRLAERIEVIECAHDLEAGVRELRLIAGCKPPFNQRGRRAERLHWLVLTSEAYPRLSVTWKPPRPGTPYLGPFTTRGKAELAVEALHEALEIRQCKTRLSAESPSDACALAEIGRCPAPCRLRISVADYARITDAFATVAIGDPAAVVSPLQQRMRKLAEQQRFEDAAALRHRLAGFLRGAQRTQRIRALTRLRELVAARRSARGGWDVAVVRHGRLAGAGWSERGRDPMPLIDQVVAGAETVTDSDQVLAGERVAEIELVSRWLTDDRVRLVHTDQGWALPVDGAFRYTPLLEHLDSIDSV